MHRTGYIARHITCLHLADPVPARGDSKTWVARQTAFKRGVGEGVAALDKDVCASTQRADQTELRADNVDDQAEFRRLYDLQTSLRLRFDLAERLTRSKQRGDHAATAKADVGQIAGFACDLERT